jgi:hypothetical protein
MHPLNHKERQDQFFYFCVTFAITITITVFSIYFTNSMLTNAVAQNNLDNLNRFQLYKNNQQQYILQLNKINSQLSSTLPRDNRFGRQSIEDFQNTLIKNNDTSVFMNKIVAAYESYSSALDNRKAAQEALTSKLQELKKCNEARRNLNQ